LALSRRTSDSSLLGGEAGGVRRKEKKMVPASQLAKEPRALESTSA